jgi:hypothetical protein
MANILIRTDVQTRQELEEAAQDKNISMNKYVL